MHRKRHQKYYVIINLLLSIETNYFHENSSVDLYDPGRIFIIFGWIVNPTIKIWDFLGEVLFLTVPLNYNLVPSYLGIM